LDKFVIDQAEGLRRMLAPEVARVIAVTGASGAGRTTTVVNLAAALTAQGKDVLVIDECVGPQSVCAMLGTVRGAGNLALVMRGERTIAEAAGRHAGGYGVIVASRENRAHYTGEQLGRLLAGPANVVLIDAQIDADGALSALALQAQDVLVVTRVGGQSLTDTYAALKRLHFAHAIGQFHVLANAVPGTTVGAGTPGAAALEHLAGVAGRYLGIALQSAGCIADDPLTARARVLGRSIVDAFPSAVSARDYRRLAAELPHWPLRPPLSAGASGAQGAAAAAGSAAAGKDSSSFNVAGNQPASAPGRSGYRADSTVPQRTTQRTTQHA